MTWQSVQPYLLWNLTWTRLIKSKHWRLRRVKECAMTSFCKPPFRIQILALAHVTTLFSKHITKFTLKIVPQKPTLSRSISLKWRWFTAKSVWTVPQITISTWRHQWLTWRAQMAVFTLAAQDTCLEALSWSVKPTRLRSQKVKALLLW